MITVQKSVSLWCTGIDMITKVPKIWGINYKGGREFHNLIVEGKKENL